MTELSPAAQAVFNAYLDNCDGAYDKEWYKGDLVMIAAALRSAAEFSVPDDSDGHYVYLPNLLAIADELEAQQ
jgi:hypothetical protein